MTPFTENADYRQPGLPWRGATLGLAAAILFGLSSPLTKLLLSEIDPLMMVALLYLGAGGGLMLYELVSGTFRDNDRREAPMRREDLPLVLGILVAGGIVGPFLMLIGLQRLSAVVGSLLLNLEMPFTILIAVGLFKEHLGRREAGAILLILMGVGLISYRPGNPSFDGLGAMAIAAACLCWAIDNNLTQRLSLRDPIAIVRTKALGAGICTMAMAVVAGRRPPATEIIGYALMVGFISYGVSVVLDLYALRMLGAAREAAFFATAPFFGAVAAVPLVGDRWTPTVMLAAAAMGSGVVLLLAERHSHMHLHEETVHDHAHMHGEHHEHEHELQETAHEPHAHLHRHLPLAHDHPHVSELHHRHEH